MVSTRKKRQSKRRLLSQLDDFDQDFNIGNTASDKQENNIVNEGTGDQEFTVGISDKKVMVIDIMVNVRNFERRFNERIDRELSNIVDTVKDGIRNAILTTIDCIVAPKIELALRSINASSGRDAASVTTKSERGENIGITAPLKDVSERNKTLHVLNINDETLNESSGRGE